MQTVHDMQTWVHVEHCCITLLVRLHCSSMDWFRLFKLAFFCYRFADIEPPDVHFNPQGYLLLSSADEAELMERDHKMQT